MYAIRIIQKFGVSKVLFIYLEINALIQQRCFKKMTCNSKDFYIDTKKNKKTFELKILLNLILFNTDNI